MTWTLLVSVWAGGGSDKVDRDAMVADARQVVAAIVTAAKENRGRSAPARGDELMEAYVRAAARAVRKLPEARQGRAFALGLGVGVDPSALMRRNPAVSGTWRRVESDAERKERLKVIGEATMHGRHDLAQHFVVSMGLTAVLGERRAEAAGVMKEMLDAMEGGSGFSFADLAANFAGVALAQLAIDKPGRLEAVEKGFRVKDYALPPKGFVEGLRTAEFEKRYGGTRDARFVKEREEIVRRIAALPGFKE